VRWSEKEGTLTADGADDADKEKEAGFEPQSHQATETTDLIEQRTVPPL
jgi:hypothetical protein